MRCFFFFKQKTAYEMRISDWSSDVCSSDLAAGGQERIKPLIPSPASFSEHDGLVRPRYICGTSACLHDDRCSVHRTRGHSCMTLENASNAGPSLSSRACYRHAFLKISATG